MRFILLLWLLAAASSANTFTPVVDDLAKIDFSSPPSMFEATIKSHGSSLPTIMYKANGKGPHPTVVLLHGFPGNEKNLDLAQSYRRAGFNVIFFHYRGAWGAEGEYGIGNQLADTASVIQLIRDGKFPQSEFIDKNKITLVGHSLGGFNALYSGMHQKTACTLAIAPTDLGGAVANLVDIDEVLGNPYLSHPLLPLKGYSFVDAVKEAKANLTAFHLAPQMGKFKQQPLMIIQGKQDVFKAGELVIISPKDSNNLAQQAINNGAKKATYLELEGDHVFSWNRIKLAKETTHWLQQNCM
ncbi:alpha/beta fold hydrolase [Thalassotalea sp. M1531]|uniref:Alpha/beta fold hydrolase n=1 Tax=Thalassotalea algicola TaxID=2716224 RepID=A0A7Y0LEP8_9GAMM|nr:alpha/beta fold hydrolase [Thalassotalea algicola]NMP33144.1 alpha/beta fold hydrolase [Thalassotalea algicola]